MYTQDGVAMVEDAGSDREGDERGTRDKERGGDEGEWRMEDELDHQNKLWKRWGKIPTDEPDMSGTAHCGSACVYVRHKVMNVTDTLYAGIPAS